MDCKKQGAKKQGHCYSKREEAMTLFFAPCFLQSIFWTLFLKLQTLKRYQVNLIN